MLASARLIPTRTGPIIMSIPGISGVQVGASSNGAEVKFRWPRPFFLAAFLVTTRAGTPSDLARVSLRMQDSNNDELVFDGIGLSAGASFLPLAGVAGISPAPFAPLGALTAWQPQWAPLWRHVKAGEQWIFQIRNGAGAARTPELLFRLAER